MDSKFKEIYSGMGYAVRELLTRSEAAAVLNKFRSYLSESSEEECSDCKDVYDAYPWHDLLDSAIDRRPPSARDMLDAIP